MALSTTRGRTHARTRRILAMALAACMTGGTTACVPGDPAREIPDDAAVETEVPIVSGASVAETRRIKRLNARNPAGPMNAFDVLGGPDRELQIRRAVLLDRGTGCQYVARTMFQDALEISPRMERDPNGTGSRHACAKAVPGSTEVVVLPGSDTYPIHASIELDRSTGCQYVVATYYQNDVSATPRIVVKGNDRVQTCEGAAS